MVSWSNIQGYNWLLVEAKRGSCYVFQELECYQASFLIGALLKLVHRLQVPPLQALES